MSEAADRDPLVLIVSGPSGSGKSTLVQKILEMPGTMASRDEFLEHARVFGKHSYGTPKKWLAESKKQGKDMVLEIDVQGAEQVKQKLPESVAIFILPPSREELERRLRHRGQDSGEEIARRLSKASAEIAASKKLYDFYVVNDDVERAGREAQAILTALRCSSAWGRGRWNQVLASFGG